MTEPTNKERAERARSVLKAYEELGGTPADEISTATQDLITDLLHLLRRDCGLIAVDREQLLFRAVHMNLDEINEDTEEPA